TIVKIMSENPKPPKQINPNIKSELEDIILRCLEKDPDKRYQKAKDVAQDLLYFKMNLSNKELYQVVNTEESNRKFSSETTTIERPRMTISGLNTLKKRKFSILHIEDDKTIKEIFLKSIQKKGLPYNYTFAESIEEAKKILNSEVFDLVLCDYNLPDGNFFNIFDDISSFPIVITTSISDPELIIEVMKKGVKEYVIKDTELKYVDKIYSIIEKNIEDSGSENYNTDPQSIIKNYEVYFVKTIGSAGADNLQFSSPRAIHISNEEKLIIADTKNSRIQVLDKQGNFLSMFSEDSMKAPCSVTTDMAGKIYVIDALDCKIRVFSPRGNLIDVFGGKGNDIGQLSSAYGITIFNNEKIYVTDPDGHKIVIFDFQGNVINSYSSESKEHGEYKSPSGIASNKNFVYILDHSIPKVKIINNLDLPEVTFGKRGTGKGDFSVPKGIGVDNEGRVYITETLSHRVQVFNAKGDWVYSFGSKGTDNGQFNGAESIAISPDGTIFVLDRGNNRIQIFSYQT
ncbi:MAG: response regulator, partial [Candidatus Sericytochromatia bacterium]|nr:response regulator [Candidatus Sericytochromatia bacterium]